MYRHIFLSLLALTILSGCAFRRITRTKNITYTPADTVRKLPAQALNVFAPRRHKGASGKVLIYMHGGNWTAGRKELYSWFGSRLARKGIVAVVIDYPKSPAADYRVMAADAAQAVSWVVANISAYGGNPDSIFISGHSAGGHLAALLATDDDYFKKAGLGRPLKGVILIDAAGLDMYGYLKDGGLQEEPTYATTFSTDPQMWKDATPLYHLHAGMPPMLIFRGGRTYPSIVSSNEKFLAALTAMGAASTYKLQPRRKHIPMITQFFNTANPRYRDIKSFMGVRR